MNKKPLDYKKLPADVRARLVELQADGADRFVFLARPSAYHYLLVAAGLGWCVYMFAATQNYLWQNWMFWIFAAVSAVLIPAAVLSLGYIVLTKFATFKRGYIFTPEKCLKTDGRSVEYWNLRELEGFQLREDLKLIEIWIGDRLEKIKAADFARAAELEPRFDEWRQTAGASFLDDYAKPEYASQSSSKTIKLAGAAAALVLVSFGVSYAAKIVNRNYDDRLAWKRTATSETLADFEAYRSVHPQGAYAAEAERRINEILGGLKSVYTAKAKPTADPAAVASFGRVLEGLGAQKSRTIYVVCREKRELDDAVVKKIKQATGLPVNSFDHSVPAAATGFRKEKLLNDLMVLFAPATRNASVSFELSDAPPAGAAVIEVDYAITPLEMYYRYDWYANGSMSINYNPAAKFDFLFALKSAAGEELYRTSFVSQFTRNLNTGLVDSRDSANFSFDKVYFISVSEDFARDLGVKFGFRE